MKLLGLSLSLFSCPLFKHLFSTSPKTTKASILNIEKNSRREDFKQGSIGKMKIIISMNLNTKILTLIQAQSQEKRLKIEKLMQRINTKTTSLLLWGKNWNLYNKKYKKLCSKLNPFIRWSKISIKTSKNSKTEKPLKLPKMCTKESEKQKETWSLLVTKIGT